MKKYIILLTLLTVSSVSSFSCTNLIVGKKASKDGSVLCSYSADSYGMFIGLCHYPAGKHKPGEMRKIYDWDTNKYWGEIPEAPETYNVIGNINEWQVTIAETTYGGREEMCDSTGLIDYGSLIYIGLQRSKTAREAIKVMTSLVEKYGFNSEGETFTICDPNEAWIMEMQGKGPGSKGVVWVAQRIPDDAICAHANQSRIRRFDMKDKKNVMYSKDVVKFAREKGWFSGKDSEFSWADAYAPADFGGRRYCDARVWSFFNRWAEGGFDEYLPWALGKDKDATPMPLWIRRSRNLALKTLKRQCATITKAHHCVLTATMTRDRDCMQLLTVLHLCLSRLMVWSILMSVRFPHSSLVSPLLHRCDPGFRARLAAFCGSAMTMRIWLRSLPAIAP